MKCEYCEKEHDGSYGSGRFCSPKCARSFSTSKNRQEINRKRSSSMKKKYDYINYKGKLITINEYNKITKSYEERIKRRSQLAVEIELEKSPYSEFDTAYNNSGSKKDENLMILDKKLHNQLHKGCITIDEIIAKKLYIGYWG